MPNSILWIGLVVLWVFVLFPILADRHPRIRRTTDTALATRVLHRGDSKRRKGSGHARKKRSGRSYRKRHHGNDAEDRMTTTAEETVTEAEDEHLHRGDEDRAGRLDDGDIASESAHLYSGAGEEADSSGEDTDDIEFASSFEDAAPARIPPIRAGARHMLADPDDAADFVPSRRGRGGYDPEADAIARATRYTFRQRAVVALILAAILCGGLAAALGPIFWWGCGGAVLSLVTYLGYLRKQVRIEQEIRRRRSARLADRGHESEEFRAEDEERDGHSAARPGMDRDTARALRRRAQLLEPDDEDPAFEHLDAYDATTARTVRHRASGGDIRRAAGA
ncbi:divisome protein SepX/GlpR [Nocardia carnea]|uniref:divisome protein SepX/GlpR n=1 Tax=Nocardia carnea TaxID=37328 RepID=UPI002456FF8A|nr:gephyrin-like molybdotransferase receptor GlpR [Nocardia carnea]